MSSGSTPTSKRVRGSRVTPSSPSTTLGAVCVAVCRPSQATYTRPSGPVEARCGRRHWSAVKLTVCVIVGAVLFATIYALLSWLKYRAFMDARFDLGNMTQAVYNTAHGHFLLGAKDEA